MPAASAAPPAPAHSYLPPAGAQRTQEPPFVLFSLSRLPLEAPATFLPFNLATKTTSAALCFARMSCQRRSYGSLLRKLFCMWIVHMQQESQEHAAARSTHQNHKRQQLRCQSGGPLPGTAAWKGKQCCSQGRQRWVGSREQKGGIHSVPLSITPALADVDFCKGARLRSQSQRASLGANFWSRLVSP